jgi:hypothetical protein
MTNDLEWMDVIAGGLVALLIIFLIACIAAFIAWVTPVETIEITDPNIQMKNIYKTYTDRFGRHESFTDTYFIEDITTHRVFKTIDLHKANKLRSGTHSIEINIHDEILQVYNVPEKILTLNLTNHIKVSFNFDRLRFKWNIYGATI